MHPENAHRIANSVDPDQTAPLGSGSALFAQTCLSENLGSSRYVGSGCKNDNIGNNITKPVHFHFTKCGMKTNYCI